MKNIALIGLMLSFVGCYKLTGKLNVTDHLTYKKGDTNRVLVIGEYNSSMTFKGKKKIVLRASNLFEKVKLTLKLPKTLKVLEEGEQTFSYNSEDLNQLFGIEGKVITRKEEGKLIETIESCPLSNIYYDCRWNDHDGRYYRHGPYTYCHGIPVGRRNVSYRLNTYTRNADINLVQDEISKAHFAATKSVVKKEYESMGLCH